MSPEASASPAEDEKQDHDEQHEAESATAVVADTGSHVIATAAKQQ
jgi:hypothetical protein